MPGGSPATAGASCQALLQAGITLSGAYYVKNPAAANAAVLVYCAQEVEGGGWALVHNSLIGPATAAFWNIPYAARLTRRGRPSIESNFYDGALYQTGAASYLDTVEDLRGASATVFIAASSGIDVSNMRFKDPVRTVGLDMAYSCHFGAGWSAPDYDGDSSVPSNCANLYGVVTQHYCACWNMNLGGDADADVVDQGVGPHVATSAIITPLDLASDGTPYTRVRRLSRFVKW